MTAVVMAVAGCTAMALTILMIQRKYLRRVDRQEESSSKSKSWYERQIGNTPCVYLPRLSSILKRHCWVKLESANPGGTGKDRVALRIIETAESNGQLPSSSPSPSSSQPTKATHKNQSNTNSSMREQIALICRAVEHSRTGGLVVEGSSGSTGIALATISALHGHGCLVVMPDDQAKEKMELLQTLGAVVHVVPVASISHPNHYVNVAKRLASVARLQLGISALFGNQFETACNANIHYETTGPEIWHQCRPDAFVMSAGTGGTIAGVAKYLKQEAPSSCQVALVDPMGSVLANKVIHGIAFTAEQQERSLKRHRYDSIAEGIGLDRITANFTMALPYIDHAYTITDQEALDMARWILKHEGMLIGSSTAMNLVGAVRFARQVLRENQTICTMVCDSGQRHMTRFWNRTFVESQNLVWPSEGVVPIDLKDLI
jgi:cysteine synthase